ncbi:hypothetical protein FO519_000685 [Halicephalobus sp. NKZ332]|nr:hypothetical protein FO519_000685 [Halicephalobus sp. NKZ332]
MACQSGIRADDDILKVFEECKQGKIRLAKIVIQKEKLVLSYRAAPTKDWKTDWKRDLPGCVDAYEPCFILFRLETPHEWLLISFADDKASSRDKMLLASTKASFKSDFGQSFIQSEYQITSSHELKFDIFDRRLNKHSRDDDTTPMTTIEKELNSASKDRIALPFAMQATQTLRGVQFPVDQDALRTIKRFGAGEIDFVQLSVDTLNEAIKLEGQEERLKASDLNSKIPKAKPRYSLFRVRDVDEQPVFFIYSIPPSVGCTIKELMLFSSCKAPFLTEVESNCRVKIDKKIEIDSGDKLDTETLIGYWRPVVQEQKATFARPPRPGAGPRRITAASD